MGSAYGRVTVIVPAALVCITVKCVNGVKCRENRQPIFADTHFYKSDLNQEKKGGGDLNMITRKNKCMLSFLFLWQITIGGKKRSGNKRLFLSHSH